ncbi:hypothetical protein FALBO_11922 [Fusarium albosuccineum]|uniref:Uncharacterized protein n=1 Tax=Fusarium albosuccineum TaxID=1237068 RepID=A0A8H4L436_9HYPO|nr:hypothetical protein FALBO_11922 [Fusarium albosuccineum]
MSLYTRLTPCWTCLKAEIEFHYEVIKTDSGEQCPVRWGENSCTFDDFECDTCILEEDKCTSIPPIVEGNATDLLKTIEFINALCDQQHPTTQAAREQGDVYRHRLDRQTRQDLVKSLAKLAIWLERVVSKHSKQHGFDHFEKFEKRTPGEKYRDYIADRRQQLASTSRKESVPPLRLTSADPEYMVWQTKIKQFHVDISQALRNMDTGARKAILKMIPIRGATPIKSWTSREISQVLDRA